MVKKLLVLLFVVILFVFSVSQSHAQTGPTFGQACQISPTETYATDNCVSTTTQKLRCEPVLGHGTICVEAPIPPPPPPATPTPGTRVVGQYCRDNYECETGFCNYAIGYIGSSSCQNRFPDGSGCRNDNYCQSSYCWKYDSSASTGLCKTKCGPTNCSGTCNVQTNECSISPTPTTGGTASGPTPTPSSTCKSNGIVSLSYSRTGCFNPLEAKSATVTCNDGTQKTFTSSFLCLATFQFDNSALSFCSTHKACPTPSPLPPTATTAPRVTPQSLTCDPVKDGVINNADYDLWLKEYTHQVNTTLTACFVPGDNTVNILDFQVWKDINYGLRPPNAPISNPPQTTPTPTPTISITPTPVAMTNELITLITNNNKAGIKSWASPKSISDLNFAVSHLSQTQRDSLASIILDTNVTGADKDKILTAMKKVLNNQSTGFYAEIWSYTKIDIQSSYNGYSATCNNVRLNTGILNASASDMFDTIMHESLHSFQCVNAGPQGALDEGSAIWVFKVAFPEGRNPDELAAGFAETVFGTVNYYRDIGTNGNHTIPLTAVTSTNGKLLELYNWLSTTDGSRLPWNSQTKLDYCYNTYYKSILRTDSQWFAKAKAASIAMAADPQCRK